MKQIFILYKTTSILYRYTAATRSQRSSTSNFFFRDISVTRLNNLYSSFFMSSVLLCSCTTCFSLEGCIVVSNFFGERMFILTSFSTTGSVGVFEQPFNFNLLNIFVCHKSIRKSFPSYTFKSAKILFPSEVLSADASIQYHDSQV